jgi:hypothetical protein
MIVINSISMDKSTIAVAYLSRTKFNLSVVATYDFPSAYFGPKRKLSYAGYIPLVRTKSTFSRELYGNR